MSLLTNIVVRVFFFMFEIMIVNIWKRIMKRCHQKHMCDRLSLHEKKNSSMVQSTMHFQLNF